jgi:hypothetical protein
MYGTELETLRTSYQLLPAKDQEFALSLILQHQRRGNLSDKQWPWVKKLSDRLTAPPTETSTATLGDTAALKALFDRAAAKIKFPKIQFSEPGRADLLKLYVAGPRAKVPGSFTVVTSGSERAYVGRITADGSWHPGASAGSSVASVLSRLLADPVGFLADNGKQLGSCCYCAIELTDDRSIAAGYGPVCAKKWGLPWGKK